MYFWGVNGIRCHSTWPKVFKDLFASEWLLVEWFLFKINLPFPAIYTLLKGSRQLHFKVTSYQTVMCWQVAIVPRQWLARWWGSQHASMTWWTDPTGWAPGVCRAVCPIWQKNDNIYWREQVQRVFLSSGKYKQKAENFFFLKKNYYLYCYSSKTYVTIQDNHIRSVSFLWLRLEVASSVILCLAIIHSVVKKLEA